MSMATAKTRSNAGVKKWTPIQAGRFYLRSMRRNGMTSVEYFDWLAGECGIKDTPARRRHYFRCVELAVKECAVAPGSVVIIPLQDSNTPWPALVVKQDRRDQSLMVRTKRHPTQAEIELGDYDPWVKTARRIQLEDVVRVESTPAPGPHNPKAKAKAERSRMKPTPANAEAGAA